MLAPTPEVRSSKVQRAHHAQRPRSTTRWPTALPVQGLAARDREKSARWAAMCAAPKRQLGGRDLAQQTAVPGAELATVAADADRGDPFSRVDAFESCHGVGP